MLLNIPQKNKLLSPNQLLELRYAYTKLLDRRSELNGSAYGEHHILIKMLIGFGIRKKFESSSQVENYVEHIISHNEEPPVF